MVWELCYFFLLVKLSGSGLEASDVFKIASSQVGGGGSQMILFSFFIFHLIGSTFAYLGSWVACKCLKNVCVVIGVVVLANQLLSHSQLELRLS